MCLSHTDGNGQKHTKNKTKTKACSFFNYYFLEPMVIDRDRVKFALDIDLFTRGEEGAAPPLLLPLPPILPDVNIPPLLLPIVVRAAEGSTFPSFNIVETAGTTSFLTNTSNLLFMGTKGLGSFRAEHATSISTNSEKTRSTSISPPYTVWPFLSSLSFNLGRGMRYSSRVLALSCVSEPSSTCISRKNWIKPFVDTTPLASPIALSTSSASTSTTASI
mmetsp:Transcript_10408/g.27272  ORF Transcript_10408/g.27272 Transcript_10408/m.27272 type:complete len:219 (-) Transcript_10408:476-1132(-)